MAYKVKSLYLSGKSKKVFRSGDIVKQEQLNAPVSELLEKGFLVEVDVEAEKDVDEDFKDLEKLGTESNADEGNLGDEEKVSNETSDVKVDLEENGEAKIEEVNESTNPLLDEVKQESVKIASLDEVKYDFLINELKSLGVSHKSNISKKEAYELWSAEQVKAQQKA